MEPKRPFVMGVRLSMDEHRLVQQLAQAHERQPSDVLRRLIRAAARELPANVAKEAQVAKQHTP